MWHLVFNVPTVVRNKNHTDNAQVTTVENNSATRESNSTRQPPTPNKRIQLYERALPRPSLHPHPNPLPLIYSVVSSLPPASNESVNSLLSGLRQAFCNLTSAVLLFFFLSFFLFPPFLSHGGVLRAQKFRAPRQRILVPSLKPGGGQNM